jgi:hypothetical protein
MFRCMSNRIFRIFKNVMRKDVCKAHGAQYLRHI